MAIVRVPPPTPQSFNKHASISELLKAQIAHFREVEMRLPHARHSGVRDRDIVTEADAARYIAYVTAVLHGRRPPKPTLSRRPSPAVVLPVRPQPTGLAIAAVSAPEVSAPSKRRRAREQASETATKTKKTPKRTEKRAKQETRKRP